MQSYLKDPFGLNDLTHQKENHLTENAPLLFLAK